MRTLLLFSLFALILAGCDSGDSDQPDPDPVAQAPVVSSVSPTTIVPNGLVVLRGQHLDDPAVVVAFVVQDGAVFAGVVTERAPAELTVRVPADLPVTGGAITVRVTTAGGTVNVTDQPIFFAQPPVVSSVFPSVVIPNGFVYLRGQHLDDAAVAVTFVAESGAAFAGVVAERAPTELTVRVPADIPVSGSAITVRVTTSAGTVDATERPVYGVETSAFGDELLPGRGLIGNVYPVEIGSAMLPDFSLMEPVSVILAPNLDVPTRSFTAGFPGVPGGLVEWFGIRFDAELEVPTGGLYTFRLRSDDGSKLYIDGALVVDNDGLHGSLDRDGTAELTAGRHTLRVDYYQGPRTQIALQLFWQPPGAAMDIVPATAFALPLP